MERQAILVASRDAALRQERMYSINRMEDLSRLRSGTGRYRARSSLEETRYPHLSTYRFSESVYSETTCDSRGEPTRVDRPPTFQDSILISPRFKLAPTHYSPELSSSSSSSLSSSSIPITLEVDARHQFLIDDSRPSFRKFFSIRQNAFDL